MLGGVFNAFAPLLFNTILEYPAALVLVALLVPGRLPAPASRAYLVDIAYAAGVGVLAAALIIVVVRVIPAGVESALAMFGAPALVC